MLFLHFRSAQITSHYLGDTSESIFETHEFQFHLSKQSIEFVTIVFDNEKKGLHFMTKRIKEFHLKVKNLNQDLKNLCVCVFLCSR